MFLFQKLCKLVTCQIFLFFFLVSISSVKQQVKLAVDNTNTIKVDSAGTKIRADNIDKNMEQFNGQMMELSNFVKVIDT